MTPEAQRIAIAGACGWKDFRMAMRWEFSDDPTDPCDMSAVHPSGGLRCHIPDYLNDLNAMHAAEAVLADHQQLAYWERLDAVCGQPRYLFVLAHATAAQRAEAFLKTLNKWDNSK